MIKKILLYFGIAIGFILSLFAASLMNQASRSLVSTSKLTTRDVERQLIDGFERSAKEVNANLPIIIDGELRYDLVSVGPGARCTYHYTFVNYSSEEINLNWLMHKLRADVKNKVCGNKDMKPSLQYGATYVYSYSGNDGFHIGSFEINRNDCGLSTITK